jgi:hypothetical protein
MLVPIGFLVAAALATLWLVDRRRLAGLRASESR